MFKLENVKESDRRIRATYAVENGDYEVSLYHREGQYMVSVWKGYAEKGSAYASFACSIFEHSKLAVVTHGRYSAKKLQELWQSNMVKNYINEQIQAMLHIDTKTLHTKMYA